jgi:acid phosphatase family membrane protein YuiD
MIEGANSLVGGVVRNVTISPQAEGSAPSAHAEAVTAVDDGVRTEIAVAIIVLVALGILVMFNVAGFRAVIGMRASVGGGS